MINGLPMPDAVTVLVSTELLAQLEADWSPPVQIHITRTPGIGSGYEMTARTHTCGQAEHTADQGWCHECGKPHQPDEPLLGLATTQQLITELAARADAAATIGEAWPTYRTTGGDQ